MNIIVPGSRVLRDALRQQGARRFRTQVALSDALSRTVAKTAMGRKMTNPEVLDGLLCALASCVQAMAPETEWDEIGITLADEIRRRLTVTGITH